MGLGFSVQTLLPDARGGGALKMGLRRISDADWIQPSPDLEKRAAAFAEYPEGIMVLPAAELASNETAELLGTNGGIAGAAHTVWEDLCILTEDKAAGHYVLTGAAVGFPTDWQVKDKIGLPLTAVHAPIDGYASQLAAGVDHFMAMLKVDEIYGRANWFVTPDNTLRYQRKVSGADMFAGLSPENAGDRLFVRCERQTLRRLPQSRAILFTIGVYIEQLANIGLPNIDKIAKSVASIGKGEHARRSAPYYADCLATYAGEMRKLEQAK